MNVLDDKVAVDLRWRVVDVDFRLDDDALLPTNIRLKRHDRDELVCAFKVSFKRKTLADIDLRVVFDVLPAIHCKDSAGIERVRLDVRDIELIGLCRYFGWNL